MLSKSEAHWHLPRWKVYFLLQLLAAAQKLLNQSSLPSPAAMSDFKQRWGLDTVWKINSESGVLSKIDFHLCGKSWGGDYKKSTIFFVLNGPKVMCSPFISLSFWQLCHPLSRWVTEKEAKEPETFWRQHNGLGLTSCETESWFFSSPPLLS